MLDIPTLRLALGLVSVVVLALFYLAVYRPTRSLFAMWWCIALMCSAASPLLLLLNGSNVQAIANPTSSLVSVVGAASVWFATRSLRGLRPKPGVVLVALVLTLVAAVLDSPATNIWAGNGTLYFFMTGLFAAATLELWRAWRERNGSYDALHDGQARVALVVALCASALLVAYYAMRFALLVSVGEDSDVFATLAGTGPTTLVLLVTLVAVTFSVASLGYDEQTRALRKRIAHDELTGLLSRAAFLDGARQMLKDAGDEPSGAVLVIADLDHFKRINDTHGHGVGDQVLTDFGTALDRTMNKGELCGRLGGEEFGIVLSTTDASHIETRLMRVSDRFRRLATEHSIPVVTVSYGVTAMSGNATLSQHLAQADEAMYSAKENGRDCVVIAGSHEE
ncbi:GGDEF domain-containing protein [Demequina globuliformis]|uniref:GGDEF domain-containing protein n=1 Tax=Demequina globuliformis TaxID=676202 RepID=UPI000780F7A4|nr:GGDEF domain-containing protein [Demequina globuliformis]